MIFVNKLDKNQIKLFAMLNFKNIERIKIKKEKKEGWILHLKTKDFEKKFLLCDFDCRTLPITTLEQDVPYYILWRDFMYNIFKTDYFSPYTSYIYNTIATLDRIAHNEEEIIKIEAKQKEESTKKELELFAANIDIKLTPKERKEKVEEYKKAFEIIEKEKNDRITNSKNKIKKEKDIYLSLKLPTISREK